MSNPNIIDNNEENDIKCRFCGFDDITSNYITKEEKDFLFPHVVRFVMTMENLIVCRSCFLSYKEEIEFQSADKGLFIYGMGAEGKIDRSLGRFDFLKEQTVVFCYPVKDRMEIINRGGPNLLQISDSFECHDCGKFLIYFTKKTIMRNNTEYDIKLCLSCSV